MLPYEIASLDEVEEQFRGLYVEAADGKFRLDKAKFKGVEFPEDVRGLKNAHDTTKAELKQVKERLHQIPKEFTAEKWAELLELEQQRQDQDLDGTKDVNELKAKLAAKYDGDRKKIEDKHAVALKAKDEEIAERDVFIGDLLIDQELDKAMAKVGVLEPMREPLKAMWKLKNKPQVIGTGMDRKGVIDGDAGQTDIGTWVESWATSDDAQHYLPADRKSGGGSKGSDNVPGGTNSNPWKKDTFNLTEQSRITREKPELAKRMKAAAGTK